MNITGKITGIKYEPLFTEGLQPFELKDFDINHVPATCILKNKNSTFAVSKWLSPKRTRSYPFERVYNSLNTAKKITVIPVVKDEGMRGDRDFIQWDTVSLMSLLDIFVIFAYYDKAEVSPKNKQKISNQKFNNEYVVSKIKEIEQYYSSALHWNLNELNTNFHDVIDKVKSAYLEIEKSTKVPLHTISGIDNFKEKIGQDVSLFMTFSREKIEKVQAREFVTLQPKESLSTLSKAKITITNYLGGQYFLTVDEIEITKGSVSLIEGKHSKDSILPSKSDIKDGLLKMILYSNLVEVKVDGEKMKSNPVLRLTSTKLKGEMTSCDSSAEQENFFKKNNLTTKQIEIIETVMKEANRNNFTVKFQYSK